MNPTQLRAENKSRFGALTTGATALEAVAANADRSCLILSNVGANSVFIGMNSSVSATTGLLLPTGVAPLVLERDRDGPLVTAQLWAISPAGVSTLVSYEGIN